VSIVFDEGAKWIWLGSQTRDKNVFACFRRKFVVDGPVDHSELVITADARCDAYLNGVWLGHGPVRSWASPWPVDTYDVKHLLRPGENVLSVLVHHFGLSTFQYLHDQAGLLAELAIDEETIVTDGQWRCVMHEGYQWPVPRISCMQGWEEQFDGRVEPGGPEEWAAVGFDDSAWDHAREIRRAGEPPHEAFEPKRIPDLTRQAVEPVAVRALEVVASAPYQFLLNPEPQRARAV
jgi:alpha-L-rhamnosidase